MDNHISDSRARTFVAALRKFEQDSDPAPLAGLFSDGATLTRLDARGECSDATAVRREYGEHVLTPPSASGRYRYRADHLRSTSTSRSTPAPAAAS